MADPIPTIHSTSNMTGAYIPGEHVATPSTTTTAGLHGNTPPNHLGTDVPTGTFDASHPPHHPHDDLHPDHDPEKIHHDDHRATHPVGNDVPPSSATYPTKHDEVGDDDDEDIDALIDDLESMDGGDEEKEEITEVGGAKPVPEAMLNTDTRRGLTEAEVTARRKKFGLNQMKEEKENLILKFLMYFVGPIQFVMEAAAILAAGLQDWVDFGVICALLLLNATVGFVQEYQAGSIVEELKKTLALKAVVLRDGELKEVEAPFVVPGDILQIEDVGLFSLSLSLSLSL